MVSKGVCALHSTDTVRLFSRLPVKYVCTSKVCMCIYPSYATVRCGFVEKAVPHVPWTPSTNAMYECHFRSSPNVSIVQKRVTHGPAADLHHLLLHGSLFLVLVYGVIFIVKGLEQSLYARHVEPAIIND